MKKRSLQEELGRLSGVLMSNKSAGSRFAWNPYFPPGVSLPEEEASEIFSPEEESSDPAVQKTRGIAGNSGRNKRGEPG